MTDNSQAAEVSAHEQIRQMVAHNSHYLTAQGPIETFVHHNTLHSFEQYPFHQAVEKAESIMGGRGYLPNEEYRRFFNTGRILEEDITPHLSHRAETLGLSRTVSVGGSEVSAEAVMRHHMVHGVSAAGLVQLSHEVAHHGALEKLRDDLPPEVREKVTEDCREFLRQSVARIGESWTVSDWFHFHSRIDVPGHVVSEITAGVEAAAASGRSVGSNAGLLRKLNISPESVEGYFACIDGHVKSAGLDADYDRDLLRHLWLRHETAILRKLFSRHFNIRLPLGDLVKTLEANLEKYAARLLWSCCLDVSGETDPFCLTHPDTLAARNFELANSADSHELVSMTYLMYSESEEELPVLIDNDFYEAIVFGMGDYVKSTDSVDHSEDHTNDIEIIRSDLRRYFISQEGYAALDRVLQSAAGHPALQGLKGAFDTFAARRDIRDYIGEVMDQTFAEVGSERSYVDFLSALTGADLNETVNAYMIQLAGSFLDHGLAAWRMPGRHLNLYNSWRLHAPFDKSFHFHDAEDWKTVLGNLPETPEQAIENALRELGIEESAWDALISRTLQKLPGWGGMIAYREGRPEDVRNAAQPATLVHFLAIRLTVETLLVKQQCRALWGIAPDLASLRQYFAERPFEFYVRTKLNAGELPETLAQGAYEILNSELFASDVTDHAEGVKGWETLARIAYAIDTAQEAKEQTYANVWRLFNLAQLLGLSVFDLIQLDAASREDLLSVLDAFPENMHGTVWLPAYEGNYRDKILNALANNQGRGRWAVRDTQPQAQIVFCIDEREEAIRRHLEETNPEIETFGAAGFFGIPMNYKALDDHGQTPLCPVVVTPDRSINEIPIAEPDEVNPAFLEGKRAEEVHPALKSTFNLVNRLKKDGPEAMSKTHDTGHKWSEYIHNIYWEAKRNPVSSYFLLDVLGLPIIALLYSSIFLPNMTAGIAKAIGRRFVRPVITKLTVDTVVAKEAAGENAIVYDAHDDHHHHHDHDDHHHHHDHHDHDDHDVMGFPLQQQAEMVQGFLRTIGLTRNFARLVTLCGHGSSSVNNPHESAYDCGACGGKHGGPNARAFADIANRPEVREILRQNGIDIPDDTWFIGSEHNTCNEAIDYFDVKSIPGSHHQDFSQLVDDLENARALSAHERCRRFASAPKDASLSRSLHHIEGRALDFSQVQPEWGHATNSFAVVGRRSMTQGLFLDRRPFLVSYNPLEDPEGEVLEKIILAVGPVGAGINLEYYFSTVDNKNYGCDTKISHNISGLIGVMEGVMSDLRTGLPAQMVEIHEPMRLQLIVEAKPEILGAIYGRQEMVQVLLNNEWIHLIASDPETGDMVMFDAEQRTFVPWDKEIKPLPQKGDSSECYRGHTDFIDPCFITPSGEEVSNHV